MIYSSCLIPGVEVMGARGYQSNSVLIKDSRTSILIDTMAGDADSMELVELVREKCSSLDCLINTHWHSDHLGGNEGIAKLFPDCQILAHVDYWQTINPEEARLNPGSMVEPSRYPKPSSLYNNKTELGYGIELIPIGGHSSDSGIIWLSKEGILVAGDNVLGGSQADSRSLPYFFYGDAEKMLLGLEFIARELKPKTIVPGHGCVTNCDKVEQHILYLHRLLERFNEPGDALIESADG
jgi:cyclase